MNYKNNMPRKNHISKKVQTCISIIITILALNIRTYSQWATQQYNTSVNLNSVIFANETNGWIAGDNGLIIKTTNGGNDWVAQNSNTEEDLYSIYFKDLMNGWAVGEAGIVLKTTDGGCNWQTINTSFTGNLSSVHFSDLSTGYAVGVSGTILKTCDGGNTWTLQTTPRTYDLKSVFFTSPTTGFAVGITTTSTTYGHILKTNDGTLWTDIATTPSAQGNTSYYSVYFTDALTGWVAGAKGRIAKTTNGGTSWTNQTTGLSTSYNILDIHFLNSSTGWAVAGAGRILNTTDGGTTWNIQALTGASLSSVYFLTPSTGYAVGSYNDGSVSTGKIYIYGTALPVELTSFSSSVDQHSNVNLFWETATEVNNYGFEVERSVFSQRQKDQKWETVGFVQGHGNSNTKNKYTFIYNESLSGQVSYRLKQIDNNGQIMYYGPLKVTLESSKAYKLLQNTPNPFNPVTAIKFQIPANSFVSIKVYDFLGKEIATLVNEERASGSHIVYWNGRDNNGVMVSSGIYLYKITAGDYSDTKKMNLMK